MNRIFVIVAILVTTAIAQTTGYLWLKSYNEAQSIAARIPPPKGFERTETEKGSFGEWLRYSPLKPGRPPVYLYNGSLKGYQGAHFAVIDIDTGNRDLQQCADAVMRLRAEYLLSVGNFESIHFNFTSGFRCEYAKWREGYRPAGYGKNSGWKKTAKKDYSREAFIRYMTLVFSYAGTFSLSKELTKVENVSQMRIGDVIIHGGFPGHAVLVVDMAENKSSGNKLFMIAQSYMPAQDVHILNNPNDASINPWYELDFGDTLYTPEWTFESDELMRF